MPITNVARVVRLSEAAAQLLVARDTLREATIALHSAADDTKNDPIWEFARRLEGIKGQVDAVRKDTADLVWKAAPMGGVARYRSPE